jgi:hypothetical protein
VAVRASKRLTDSPAMLVGHQSAAGTPREIQVNSTTHVLIKLIRGF